MDLDGYYVSKLPFYPASQQEQAEFRRDIKELMDLVPKLARIDVDFDSYLNKYPRSGAVKLEDYYGGLGAQRKSCIASDSVGSLTNLRASLSDGWIVVRADYVLDNGEEHRNADIIYLKLQESNLARFITYVLNQLEKKSFQGNILESILGIRIPKFRNRQAVGETVREYSSALSQYAELAKEIEERESHINKRIYESFELKPDEISEIEKPFSSESLVLSLFPRPRSPAESA
jgi:hypothetical protein